MLCLLGEFGCRKEYKKIKGKSNDIKGKRLMNWQSANFLFSGFCRK